MISYDFAGLGEPLTRYDCPLARLLSIVDRQHLPAITVMSKLIDIHQATGEAYPCFKRVVVLL